jgi:hypothetical protein
VAEVVAWIEGIGQFQVERHTVGSRIAEELFGHDEYKPHTNDRARRDLCCFQLFVWPKDAGVRGLMGKVC